MSAGLRSNAGLPFRRVARASASAIAALGPEAVFEVNPAVAEVAAAAAAAAFKTLNAASSPDGGVGVVAAAIGESAAFRLVLKK